MFDNALFFGHIFLLSDKCDGEVHPNERRPEKHASEDVREPVHAGEKTPEYDENSGKNGYANRNPFRGAVTDSF